MKHGGIVTQDNRQEKTRTRVSKFYGKLPPNVVEDLDGLLLKMKETNKKLLKKKVIDASEIKPLSDEEYLRLWGYIRHCCDLVSTWKNVRNAICVFAEKSGRSFDSLHDEFVDSMTVFVYTYAWRKYVHSEDCGYVFKTAEYGYKSWAYAQNSFHSGAVAAKELHDADNPSSGRKVVQS